MRPIKTVLLALSPSLLFSLNAFGDSWTLTQTAITQTATTLFQANANNAKQGVNVINLNNAQGVVVNADQTFTTSGHNVTLSQDATNASHQAVNYIAAAHITAATQTVTQVDAVLLKQQNSSSNSLQALNIAITTGAGTQINQLVQTVSANSASFDSTGSGNIQAGNYLQADSLSATAGDVVQNFTISGNVTYALTGANNLQAGNVAINNVGFKPTGTIIQHFSAANVNATFSDTDANGSIMAANYVAEQP